MKHEKGPARTPSQYEMYCKGLEGRILLPSEVLTREQFYELPSPDRRQLASTSDSTFGKGGDGFDSPISGCPKKGGGIRM
jgi:hypothetical protein